MLSFYNLQTRLTKPLNEPIKLQNLLAFNQAYKHRTCLEIVCFFNPRYLQKLEVYLWRQGFATLNKTKKTFSESFSCHLVLLDKTESCYPVKLDDKKGFHVTTASYLLLTLAQDSHEYFFCK